jgi:dephospho-CoA kinase
MKILGITGSIASGKSTVAKMFAFHGVPVFDADKAAHMLLQSHQPTIEHIAQHFPESLRDSAIHRPTLGKHVFGNPHKLQQLEAILHPAIRQQEHLFIARQRAFGHTLVLLDIPLLFETQAHHRVDASILVRAPLFLITQRALTRPHMTQEKLYYILEKQMPIYNKAKLATHIIPTGAGRGATMQHVKHLLNLYTTQG